MNKYNSIKAAVFGILASVLTLTGCQQAEAVEIGLGYTDNKIINQEGVNVKVGSEYNNIRYGITAMANDERVETYGVYLGVPLRVQGTQLVLTPTITTEYYHEARETIGGVGMNIGYCINENLTLEAQGTVNRSFDSHDYTGEVYSIGLVNRF